MATNESRKTVLEVLRHTTDYFNRHQIENARLNSEHLMAHVLGGNRIELYMEFDRALYEDELAPLRELVKKRAQGIPLQHLLGNVEFYGRTFLVDSRVLIPRPETELLLELLLKRKNFSSVLDVGTGSGVIAITLKAERPESRVEALDVSTDALAVAAKNAESLGADVKFYQSDLLKSVQGQYDLIVANLPYIATETIPSLSREVQNDPKTALDGGVDGQDLIRRLIIEAKSRLTSGGLLALEIGHDQSESLSDFLKKQNYRDISAENDYNGFPRFLFAIYG